MKILAVTNMYPTDERPSYGIFVQRQIETLKKLDHQIDVVFLNGIRSKTAYFEGFITVSNAVKQLNPELIHAHYGLSGFVASFTKLPLVMSLCGDDVLGTPSKIGGITLKSRVIRQLTRSACHRAKEIIVKSPEMGEVVKKWGFQNVHIIPNGVETDFFKPIPRDEARVRLGLDLRKRYLLFPSTPYEVRKRVDLAREVTRQLAAHGEPSELLIVYHQPQEVLRDYYSAADVMLLTSDWEGSPNVLKEAMACELPTVCFDVGDVTWLCSGTKFHRVVPRGNVAEMIRQVKEILGYGVRGDGRARIVNELSAPATAKKIDEVFKLAISKPNGAT